MAPAAGTVQELTDNDIETNVESLVPHSDSAFFDPTIIESALTGFAMPTKILDADARITTYCADFFESLESVGCSSFVEDNPKKSVRLLCSGIESAILKKEMQKRLGYDESI